MKKHNRNDNRTKTVIFKTTENQKESSPKNKIQFEELKNSPSSKNFSPMSKQPTKIEFQPNTENPTIKHSKTFIRKSAKKSMTSKIRNSLEIFDEIKPPLTSKSSSNNNKNIRVYIRFRPFNELESDLLSNNVGWATPIYKENNCVTIDTHKSEHEIGPTFKFDKVFPSSTEQKKVYETIGKEIDDYCQNVFQNNSQSMENIMLNINNKIKDLIDNDFFKNSYLFIIEKILIPIYNEINDFIDNYKNIYYYNNNSKIDEKEIVLLIEKITLIMSLFYNKINNFTLNNFLNLNYNISSQGSLDYYIKNDLNQINF
jgi:hypothetical protein